MALKLLFLTINLDMADGERYYEEVSLSVLLTVIILWQRDECIKLFSDFSIYINFLSRFL